MQCKQVVLTFVPFLIPSSSQLRRQPVSSLLRPSTFGTFLLPPQLRFEKKKISLVGLDKKSYILKIETYIDPTWSRIETYMHQSFASPIPSPSGLQMNLILLQNQENSPARDTLFCQCRYTRRLSGLQIPLFSPPKFIILHCHFIGKVPIPQGFCCKNSLQPGEVAKNHQGWGRKKVAKQQYSHHIFPICSGLGGGGRQGWGMQLTSALDSNSKQVFLSSYQTTCNISHATSYSIISMLVVVKLRHLISIL